MALQERTNPRFQQKREEQHCLSGFSEEVMPFDTINLIEDWLGILEMITLFFCCKTATLTDLGVGKDNGLVKLVVFVRLETIF